ncbi:hypothetical protein P4S72_18425 [Vibrio sp. PP-XX7]
MVKATVHILVPVLATALLLGCNLSKAHIAWVYYKATIAPMKATDHSTYDKASLYIWNDEHRDAYAESTQMPVTGRRESGQQALILEAAHENAKAFQ